MTLPAHSFQGANFFANIRTQMNMNRGLFGGSDGDLQYVIMDAVLYRLEIFRRPNNRSFTDAGKALSKDIRVLVNGQVFGAKGKYKYNDSQPGPMPWEGQVIINGATLPGDPSTKPASRFIGRQNAIPVWRYFVGRGDPSGNNPSLHHAMGSLLPLIEGGVPLGCQNIGTPPNVRQRFSPTTCDLLNNWGPKVGKTLVGLHRTSGCLFVICQEFSYLYAFGGLSLKNILSRLQTMGVNDAVICDSSTSSTLIVDRTLHAEPRTAKNNSIPTGLMFRLKPLIFRPHGTVTIQPSTTDLYFLGIFSVGTVLRGIEGTITARSAGGMALRLTSLGSIPPYSNAGVAAEFGISSLPVTLTTTSTDLTNSVSFSRTSPNVSLSLTLTRTVGQLDRITGNLTVTNNRGTIIGAVIVPI